jgi:2-C-methyl-D-erythritol 2,4-cyclodiphosphate synthase
MIRIGIGYDVHKLVPNRRLVLGGVEIPCEVGLEGHSDADVLLHALTDALLGAAALGDIGTHFPPDDEQYRGIDSCKLLKVVCDLLCKHEWVVGNIDAVVVAEFPRLAGYITQMRENIAEICGAEVGCVSVKATTEEGLGLAGKGIGAHCVCTLCKKT